MSRRRLLVWAGLTALLALTFRAVVEGDGVGYYSYLHTLLYDHDLDFSDEYRAALDAGVPVWADWITWRSATGLLVNFYPVGTALLSAPAYLGALAFHPDGKPLFGPPFTTAYVAASLLWGLLALAVSHRLAVGAVGSRWPALVGVAAAGLATPLTFYLTLEPSYSHTFSAFAAAVFVYAWWRGGWRESAPKALGLGLLAALMALVRYQDGLLAAIVLLDLRRARWRVLVAALGAAAGFAPQLAVDQVLFGGWLPGRPPELAFEPWPGHYLQLLAASQHGLFLWCPAMLAALIGAALLPDRRLALGFLVGFLGQVLLQGAAPDWSAGHAFGPRRFAVLTVFL
ncbi:MAG TPA: hypothetical protein VK131_12930, partial [Candidatus Acidoferrales bacterium]|nr:hypothetical protein [Candidatus Acidoferrales bacterium]